MSKWAEGMFHSDPEPQQNTKEKKNTYWIGNDNLVNVKVVLKSGATLDTDCNGFHHEFGNGAFIVIGREDTVTVIKEEDVSAISVKEISDAT